MSWIRAAFAICIAGLALAAGAQQPQQPNPMDVVPDKMPNDIPYGTPVTLERAQAAISAAVAESNKRGWKLNVTVVDSGANLVAFARMDGAHADGVIDPPADGARQRRYPYAADILAPLSVGRAAAQRQSCERQHARRRHRQQRAGAGGG